MLHIRLASFLKAVSLQTVQAGTTAMMNQTVSTKDPAAVAREVKATYQSMFPNGNRLFVPGAFSWATECFTGGYADYQAVDTEYHDFEHTLQGALCMVRILHGRWKADVNPPLTQQFFELGLLAILLHDTGYLKKRDDMVGTGAKYTATHVSRSTDFAAGLLAMKGYSTNDIKAVQNMIRCTGVDATLNLKKSSATRSAPQTCSGKWRRTTMWKSCRFSTMNSPRPRTTHRPNPAS
jgi:hypothetical protein